MDYNIQPVEKKSHNENGHIDLHSIFYTIQGEGPFSGHRSVFVRLAGCNLQCPGCDTEYTQGRKTVSTQYILDKIQTHMPSDNQINKTNLIVITGGEPFRQNITPLVSLLVQFGYTIQIETNGVLPPPVGLLTIPTNKVFIVVSPKTSKVNDVTASNAMCFKYVMQEGSINSFDGLPTQALLHKASPHIARFPEGKPVYISPMDEKNAARNALNMDVTVRSCLKFGYILGLQIHKILDLE